ncbi:MAG TPA: hypothetical protein VFQ25_02555 [Ktedonobacterales bacterium]|nr:hypothetical protein [Ktedonobacterales bacterium]
MTSSGSAAARRQARSRLGCWGVLALLVLLPAAFGGFEYIVWHRDVDSYTFVARDGGGQVIGHVASHDAKAASTLRRALNAHTTPLLEDTPLWPSPECQPTLNYTIPVASYTYTFSAGGQVVETITSYRTICGVALASCGAITLYLEQLPWNGPLAPSSY